MTIRVPATKIIWRKCDKFCYGSRHFAPRSGWRLNMDLYWSPVELYGGLFLNDCCCTKHTRILYVVEVLRWIFPPYTTKRRWPELRVPFFVGCWRSHDQGSWHMPNQLWWPLHFSFYHYSSQARKIAWRHTLTWTAFFPAFEPFAPNESAPGGATSALMVVLLLSPRSAAT